MNKQDCLAAAERAKIAAAEATQRASVYVVAFGSKDALSMCALEEARVARQAAIEWLRVADCRGHLHIAAGRVPAHR